MLKLLMTEEQLPQAPRTQAEQSQTTAQLLITSVFRPRTIVAIGVAGAIIRAPEIIEQISWFILRFTGK